jgi:hypothetical protein
VATIASLLRDRVTLRVRSVDRLFLQAYVPKLMTSFQVVRFLLDRGHRIPSPVLLGRIGRAYVEAIDRFATRNAIPVLRFGKGEVKEQIARRYFRAAERDGRFGVVLIGVAQEKAMAWRGWRRGGPDGHPHFEFGRQQVFVNHYYFYVRDPDWGPGFIKTCPYAPFPAWVYVNGHEWAKRQAEKAGLEFEALDNGFRSVADAEALAAICNRLTARDVQRFYRRWEARLPSPLSAEDRRRGYRHQLAFRQLELSDTRVFDRPGAGRAWFEQTLRDQLTLGRPDQVAVVFGRRVSRQTRDASTRASSTAAPSPRSRCTTARRRSSNTSRRAARCGPRRRSTTRATSASGACSRARTGTRSCASGTTSTSACSTPSFRRARAPPTPPRSNASYCRPATTASPPPGCASATRA